MLEVKNLTKKFKKKTALNNISISFDKNVYGILAPNGAGKTTLLRCITQLYPQGSKTVYYNGCLISKHTDILNKIGYLPQQFGLFKDLTVKDALTLLANFKGADKSDCDSFVRDSVELVNLSDRIGSKVGSLSGGMIRRLGIAAALLNNPEILLFDEPTSGLDPEERLRFKNIITKIKKDKIIIISTHIVEDVEAVCDKVVIMKEGSVISTGSCKDICNIAENKVYLFPEKDTHLIEGEYHIQKQLEIDGEKYIKVLTGARQAIDAMKPTVEDGYICAIEKI